MSDHDRSTALTGSSERIERVNRWCLDRLTFWNRSILAGEASPEQLRAELRDDVLARSPLVGDLTPRQAQQLVVLLGLAGASVARHYQEADRSHRDTPERAFEGLPTGPDGLPFTAYFARLTERTGTGHPVRDSYASLVRWNLPAVEARWAGQPVAELGSAFDDGLIRTYTGTGDEERFFTLMKGSEVLERAVNHELLPLSDGGLDLADPAAGPEALHRIGRAVLLLDALRTLNHDFAEQPPERSLAIGYFLDVFRQYAVHWQDGDVPPSGALDAEALVRDLLVGVALPGYPERLRRVFPGLLVGERVSLEQLIARPSIPELALRRAGLDHPPSAESVAAVVARHPVLAALYLLLNAHARVAGVHLRLSKQFLFTPQRHRDRDGSGDTGVVSNRTGTTGMDESWLERLTRARHQHALIGLHAVPVRTLEALAGLDRVRAELGDAGLAAIDVHFAARLDSGQA